MRRRRRFIRFVTRGIATAAIGGFVGFLVPTVVADLAPKPAVQQAAVPESPVARQFINAYTSDDQVALTAMNIRDTIKLRASRYRSDFLLVDTPVHLGSYLYGDITLHAYAAHAVQKDGTETTLGWRIGTQAGQLLIFPPPGQIEEP